MPESVVVMVKTCIKTASFKKKYDVKIKCLKIAIRKPRFYWAGEGRYKKPTNTWIGIETISKFILESLTGIRNLRIPG